MREAEAYENPHSGRPPTPDKANLLQRQKCLTIGAIVGKHSAEREPSVNDSFCDYLRNELAFKITPYCETRRV